MTKHKEQKKETVETTIYCTRCGCPRPSRKHPCGECKNFEFTHNGGDPTHLGWEARNEMKSVEVKETVNPNSGECTYHVWLDGFIIGSFDDPYWANYLVTAIKNEDKWLETEEEQCPEELISEEIKSSLSTLPSNEETTTTLKTLT